MHARHNLTYQTLMYIGAIAQAFAFDTPIVRAKAKGKRGLHTPTPASCGRIDRGPHGVAVAFSRRVVFTQKPTCYKRSTSQYSGQKMRLLHRVEAV